ncbi:N-acetylmuramoyl-L-alanine amidase [Terribacillus sp. AE2B 122]|uniref:N-acetylmuramoyl-L-alanine amidase n=1 Tax=Terribacillus sp. AE2B 122 TaxID=1331902 RepID=UPI0015820586|nr:N-acetylmuramoyl-L-alanine amidase [Terribacillus sp. AE2B 122]
MAKVFIDPGHGGKDSGASSFGLKEKDIVLMIAKKIASQLKENYNDIEVMMSRTDDVFISLSERASMADKRGAELFVSIHINAGGGEGFETYRYISTSEYGDTGRAQDVLHEAIYKEIKAENVKNRGKKVANFAVLRETSMKAILTENLFIDNEKDAALLKESGFLDRVVLGHVKGIANILELEQAGNEADKNSNSLVVVKDNSDGWLWTYNSADWDDKAIKVKPNEAFTIVGTYMVNGSKMYKLKSGLYITASPKFVKIK